MGWAKVMNHSERWASWACENSDSSKLSSSGSSKNRNSDDTATTVATAFQKVPTTSHRAATASPKTTSIDPARTSSSATDARTKSSAIPPRAALARSSATDSISSPTTMAPRMSSAPTELAPADEAFANVIFSSPKHSLNMRASGTRASIPSRVDLTEKVPAKLSEEAETQSSSAAVTRPPSPSTNLDEQTSAATAQKPSRLANAKHQHLTLLAIL